MTIRTPYIHIDLTNHKNQVLITTWSINSGNPKQPIVIKEVKARKLEIDKEMKVRKAQIKAELSTLYKHIVVIGSKKKKTRSKK